MTMFPESTVIQLVGAMGRFLTMPATLPRCLSSWQGYRQASTGNYSKRKESTDSAYSEGGLFFEFDFEASRYSCGMVYCVEYLKYPCGFQMLCPVCFNII